MVKPARVTASGQAYEFGPFHLDPAERRLLRDGRAVPLTPKAFEVLLLLVEHSGQVVEKDHLINSVWADSFVEEGNLKVTVSMLRKALDEGATGTRYIETVARRGYRFAADVKPLRVDETELVVREVTRRSLTIEQQDARANADFLVGEIKLHKRTAARLMIAGIVVLTAIGFGLYKRVAPHHSPTPFQVSRVMQLTTTGKTRVATLAPDGKLFAYSVQGEKASLWLGHVDGGEARQILAPVAGFFVSLAFAPDGSSLYYTFTENLLPVSRFSSTGALYRLPVFGGAPEKIRDNVRNNITFSPDGKQFAFVRNEQGDSKTALIIAATDGTSEREVARSRGDQGFSWHSPSWSPDGKTIALGAPADESGSDYEIVLVDVAEGAMRPLTRQGWSGVEAVAWRHDGTGLIAIASEKQSILKQLWEVAYPDGQARRIVTDRYDYGYPISLSADDHSLLVTQTENQSDIWVAPASNLAQARQVTFSSPGRENGFTALDWTPDGRIIYSARAGEGWTLWAMKADGSDQRQLIPAGGRNFRPSITDDGRYLVFQSNRSGKEAVWRANLDGSDMRQMIEGERAINPCVSPDGKWIVYGSQDDDFGTLYRMSMDGGEAQVLTDKRGAFPRVSPDSRLVACSYEDEGRTKLAILPIEGGAPLKLFEVPRLANLRSVLRWTADGKAVCYRDWENGIWRQEINGGEPKRLAGLPQQRLQGFGWSRDGKYLAFAPLIGSRDALLIHDVKTPDHTAAH